MLRHLVLYVEEFQRWNFNVLMMNCRMVDWQKVLSLISSWGFCQRFLSSQISNMVCAGFKPGQSMSSGFVKGSCTAAIKITPWCQHISGHYNSRVPESSNNDQIIVATLFCYCFLLCLHIKMICPRFHILTPFTFWGIYFYKSWPILEGKNMHVIFQKKV